jgi:hypothetical protein
VALGEVEAVAQPVAQAEEAPLVAETGAQALAPERVQARDWVPVQEREREQDLEQAPGKEPVRAKAQGSGPEKARVLDLAQAMAQEPDSARDLEPVQD